MVEPDPEQQHGKGENTGPLRAGVSTDCGERTSSGNRRVARWERYLLIALLAAGILLRIARLLELAHHPEWIVPDRDQVDMAFFYNYGQDLANRCRAFLGLKPPDPNPLPPSPVHWTQNPSEGFMRPPAYSVFLAAAFLLSGNWLMAPLILQAILGVLNALLAWRLARRIAGPAPALITAAFMLFYWVLLVYEGVCHAQTLMIFLALVLTNTLEYWSRHPSLTRAALAGCTITLNMLAAPATALFAPAAALWMALWLHRQTGSWKISLPHTIRHVTLTAVCSALLVAPVTLSNWRTEGSFSLVSTGSGVMLLIGNHEGADGYYRDPLKQFGFEDTGDHDENCRLFEKVTGIRVTPKTMGSVSAQFAWKWIRGHPGQFLRLTLKRALIYWQPKEVSHNVQEYCLKQMSSLLRWLPGGFSEILGGLGAAAVMALFSIRCAAPAVRLRWMLPFLYTLLFYLPFTVFYYAGHYRVPILPFLAMMAAAGLWSALIGLRARPAVASTALACVLILWVGTRLIPVAYEEDWERWFYFRGEAARRLRNESGLQDLERLVETAGLTRSPSACLFMAQRAAERQDFDTAALWCRRGLDLENMSTKRRVWLLELLAGALTATGADPATLEAVHRDLVRYAPDNFLGRMFLANRAITEKNYPEALVHLLAATECRPENSNAWFLLGQCQMALGFPKLAEAAYREGMERNPADPWPAMGLSGVLEATGRLDEALQAAEEALRRRPDLQVARETIDRLRQAPADVVPVPETAPPDPPDASPDPAP